MARLLEVIGRTQKHTITIIFSHVLYYIDVRGNSWEVVKRQKNVALCQQACAFVQILLEPTSHMTQSVAHNRGSDVGTEAFLLSDYTPLHDIN